MEQTNVSETNHDQTDEIPEIVFEMVSKMSNTSVSIFWYQYLVAVSIAIAVPGPRLVA